MPKDYDDFLADLDRQSLSDDPFGVEDVGALDDEDLELLLGGRRKTAAKPAASKTSPKPVAPKKRAPANTRTRKAPAK